MSGAEPESRDDPQIPRPSSHPRIGVGVGIRNGASVLLLRRTNVHGAGTWSTPGGHLEFGESPEECAVREASEETALELGAVRFLALTNDVFQAEGKHYLTVWMEAEFAGGEPKLNAPYESDAISWFPWDELPQPLFLPFRHLIDGDSYPPRAILSRRSASGELREER